MLRPASGLLVLMQEWEPRLRKLLWLVGLAWGFLALLVAGLVALVTWAAGGPWWVYLVGVVLGAAMVVPYVVLALALGGFVAMWRERVELAAKLERETWPGEP